MTPKKGKKTIRQGILDTGAWLSARNKGKRTFNRERVFKFANLPGTKDSKDNELRRLEKDGCIQYDKHNITFLDKGLRQGSFVRPFHSNQDAFQEAISKFKLCLRARGMLFHCLNGNAVAESQLYESFGQGMQLDSFTNVIRKLVKWEVFIRCKAANGHDGYKASDFLFPFGRPEIVILDNDDEERHEEEKEAASDDMVALDPTKKKAKAEAVE